MKYSQFKFFAVLSKTTQWNRTENSWKLVVCTDTILNRYSIQILLRKKLIIIEILHSLICYAICKPIMSQSDWKFVKTGIVHWCATLPPGTSSSFTKDAHASTANWVITRNTHMGWCPYSVGTHIVSFSQKFVSDMWNS